jgi:hypothetical protein
MTKKYYVEFLYPGMILAETSKEEITKTKFDNPVKIKLPDSSYGFRVMSREETEIDGELLKGEFKNCSGWYIAGEKFSLADVERSHGKHSILYCNMKNSYDYVVKTKFGNYVPLEKRDVHIPENV